jgi:hypothetical protein
MGSRPASHSTLQPFDQLSPALQHSNLDIVDDIPTKLAIAGLRLCPEPDAVWPVPLPPEDKREASQR